MQALHRHLPHREQIIELGCVCFEEAIASLLSVVLSFFEGCSKMALVSSRVVVVVDDDDDVTGDTADDDMKDDDTG